MGAVAHLHPMTSFVIAETPIGSKRVAPHEFLFRIYILVLVSLGLETCFLLTLTG